MKEALHPNYDTHSCHYNSDTCTTQIPEHTGSKAARQLALRSTSKRPRIKRAHRVKDSRGVALIVSFTASFSEGVSLLTVTYRS
jgi:hypothetical protein